MGSGPYGQVGQSAMSHVVEEHPGDLGFALNPSMGDRTAQDQQNSTCPVMNMNVPVCIIMKQY